MVCRGSPHKKRRGFAPRIRDHLLVLRHELRRAANVPPVNANVALARSWRGSVNDDAVPIDWQRPALPTLRTTRNEIAQHLRGRLVGVNGERENGGPGT